MNTHKTLVISLAITLLAASGCANSTPRSPGAATSPEAHAATTRGSLGTFTSDASGFDTHTYYYDSGEQVVVFDAQFTPELAREMLAQIKSETTSPITHVVVTHPNPDKFNGAAVFQGEGAQLVVSAATAEAMPAVHEYKKYYFTQVARMFSEETYPALPTPDIVFEKEHTIDLGNSITVTLETLRASGVASTQTVAYIAHADALFVGDLIHHNAHAWLEGGIEEGIASPDLDAWASALTELEAYPKATVYAGRGEPAPVSRAVPAQREYLETVATLRDAYLEDHAAPHDSDDHAALASAIKAAFPDHSLDYLVDYSVYGLFNVAK